MISIACSGCAIGQTGSVDSLAGTRAALFGSVVSNTGGAIEYWIQYGETTGYGSESAHATGTASPNSRYGFRIVLTGLQRSTTYHWRVCGRDDQQQGGPGCGEDKTFTTTNLDCGDVITHDVTLSGSMRCDFQNGIPPTGLVAGANGVDINLNGFHLLGPPGRPAKETAGTGIDNSGGFDDVTIRNGGVQEWGNAILLEDASFNAIRDVDMSRGNLSLQITRGESNTVRSSSMTGTLFGSGLWVVDADGLVIADSSGDQWSIGGSRARIVRNVIAGCSQFHSGLSVSGNRNRIADNQIRSCSQGALVLRGGSDNELIGNTVSGTGASPPPSDFGDGIFVGPFTAGTLVQGNSVNGNDDDGIDVRASSARLQGNHADDNVDFGIDAVAGVTDLGANTASGNGNPLQCRNVFCGASP